MYQINVWNTLILPQMWLDCWKWPAFSIQITIDLLQSLTSIGLESDHWLAGLCMWIQYIAVVQFKWWLHLFSGFGHNLGCAFATRLYGGRGRGKERLSLAHGILCPLRPAPSTSCSLVCLWGALPADPSKALSFHYVVIRPVIYIVLPNMQPRAIVFYSSTVMPCMQSVSTYPHNCAIN